jgi:hypothetical protein
VDPNRSRVYDRDRGLFDRLESVFEDSPTGDRELFALSNASSSKPLEQTRSCCGPRNATRPTCSRGCSAASASSA